MDDMDQIDELLAMLDSDELEDRLLAAKVLGEVGDREALRVLRARMAAVNKEFGALVLAVGKLKKRLGVK